MIRVYLDWNVYSRIKTSTTYPYPELREILLQNRNYFFPYSTAHIIDIYESYLKVGWDNVQGHLSTLQLANNLYLKHPFGQEIGFHIEDPFEALKNHILDRDSTATFDDSIKDEEDPDYIDYFPETTKFLKEQDELLELQDKVISSFQGMLNIFLSGNFKQDYQKGMNISKGKLLDKRTNPIDYLDKIAVNKGYNSFKDYNEGLLSKINKNPNFMDELSALFVGIDLSGFKEDKNSLTSTITDSIHCAYASTCDIFIVDDKNTFDKSIEVFKIKRIQTKTFRPAHFIEYYKQFNLQFENGKDLINFVFNYSKAYEPVGTFKTENLYYLKGFILDFFNIITTEKDNETCIRLYKYTGNNDLTILPCEKEDLITKINNLFGKPALIYDDWDEIGILNSGWIYNKLELVQLSINKSQVILSFTKCIEF